MTIEAMIDYKLMTQTEKETFIAQRFREIMEVIGLDLNDPSLAETPNRIAKMYTQELFTGLNEANFPEVTFFPVQGQNNMVFVKTKFLSTCEHHFLPISGTAHIAYIPNEKLIGLSKIPRIVRHFAKQPQVQERLTEDIANKLIDLLNTQHVAVSIKAKHYCVIARGVEDHASHTITNALKGDFHADDRLRREFFDAARQ